jgi:hypothetical protein
MPACPVRPHRGHHEQVPDLRRKRHPETGSAGRPPEELRHASALALGRTSCARVAGSHRDSLLAGRRGRAIVDIALGGDRCAGPLGDDPLDHHDAVAAFVVQPHLITGPDGMRGLDPYPVDPDVPGPAGTGRGRAGPGQPHRPDPAVHPPVLITCHSANCNVLRARGLRPASMYSATSPGRSGAFAALLRPGIIPDRVAPRSNAVLGILQAGALVPFFCEALFPGRSVRIRTP